MAGSEIRLAKWWVVLYVSRTFRSKPSHVRYGGLGKMLLKTGKVRDGTFTTYAPSCAHHGSCWFCEGNRNFASRRQAPIVEGAWQR